MGPQSRRRLSTGPDAVSLQGRVDGISEKDGLLSLVGWVALQNGQGRLTLRAVSSAGDVAETTAYLPREDVARAGVAESDVGFELLLPMLHRPSRVRLWVWTPVTAPVQWCEVAVPHFVCDRTLFTEDVESVWEVLFGRAPSAEEVEHQLTTHETRHSFVAAMLHSREAWTKHATSIPSVLEALDRVGLVQ